MIPKHRPPEQARGGELDGGSDFYSLGVVAFHCLAGRAPFTGDDPLSVLYSHLHDPVPEPELSSEGDRRVFSVVRELMAKDPPESALIDSKRPPVTAKPPARKQHLGTLTERLPSGNRLVNKVPNPA